MITNNFLEFMNLNLTLWDTAILSILMLFMRKRQHHLPWGDSSIQVSLALGLIIGGHALIRGWTWFWRFSIAHDWWTNVEIVENVPIFIIGLLMISIGLIWLAYRLYDTMSPWYWVAGAAVITLFSAGTTWLV